MSVQFNISFLILSELLLIVPLRLLLLLSELLFDKFPVDFCGEILPRNGEKLSLKPLDEELVSNWKEEEVGVSILNTSGSSANEGIEGPEVEKHEDDKGAICG